MMVKYEYDEAVLLNWLHIHSSQCVIQSMSFNKDNIQLLSHTVAIMKL